MRPLALATCNALPAWEIDDRYLHAALSARGLPFERPVWSDPMVDWSRFAAVLIRTTWDYHLHLPEFLRWAERVSAVTPLWNPLPIVEWNSHKRYLFDLAERGVSVMPSRLIPAGTHITPDLLHAWCCSLAQTGSCAVLKPCVGATAREILPFRYLGLDHDDGDAVRFADLPTACAHARGLLEDEDLLLQPWCGSVTEEGEYSILFIDGRFAHGVRKVPKAGDYRVQDDFGARDEPWEPDREALSLAQSAVDSVPIDLLYARVDLLRCPSPVGRTGGLCVGELELIEPSLFLRHVPATADRLVDALLKRLA